jgi:hypothetical protein
MGMESEVAILAYLDADDLGEFNEYFGTEYEHILVAGSRTNNRLARYLPESENHAIKVIFTAVVRDFGLPSIRYSYVIAVSVYAMLMDGRNVTAEVKNIVTTELALVAKHLMDDEKCQYDRGLELVTQRWNEYISNPDGFVL